MLNKKVLVAAIVGGLFAGSAGAVDFTAGTPAAQAATVANFAKEIKTTSAVNTAATLTGTGVQVKWKSGYAYSPGEVRYVRVEAAPHVVFESASTVSSTGGTGGLAAGAINGVGTNVITFSVTADAAAGATSDIVFTLDAAVKVLSIADSDIKVSLYDTPSQAQAGGSTGLITGGSVAGKYFTFGNSLKWETDARTAVADVEANPSYTLFTSTTANNNPAATGADLNAGLGVVATGALKKDSSPIAVTDLLDTALGKSSVVINGDFSFVANQGGTFSGAALGRVVAFGAAAKALAANSATFDLGAGAASVFSVEKLATTAWNPSIAASSYTATLNPVINSANAAEYNLPTLGEVAVGKIERNGTELQAPLAQIPNNWLSRLVLTNTSGVERPYSITVLTEENVNVSKGTLNGVIPANGTKVIDDLREVFTGNNRATLVVNVAGPDNSIQGLYQIVNPEKGSISNHALIRPSSN